MADASDSGSGAPTHGEDATREVPVEEDATRKASVEKQEGDSGNADSVRRDAISEKVDRLFDLVPEIGTRWRWYDIPYRLLTWLLSGWRRQLWPWRVRRIFNKGLNFMLSFDHYERLKVELLDDPMENLIVPEGEELEQGGIWVIDFFPPSHYTSLNDSLRKNGWDKEGYSTRLYGTNAEQIARARRGVGSSWSRLGTVTNPDSRFSAFEAKRETLPKEFSLIELTAVQVGRSLTAVIAFVRLSDVGKKALNNVWKAQHEPILTWQGFRRPDVQGRLFAGFRATQSERQRLHDIAREWLSSRCGGFFSASELGQPVIDFGLFSRFDPTSQGPYHSMRDPLRALGLDENYLYNYVSPQLPGIVLVPPSHLNDGAKTLRNSWGIVGSRVRVSELNDRPGYGERPFDVTTLAAMFDDEVRAIALYIAVEAYIDEVRGTYAVAIDRARSRHRRFSARRLEQLRGELLTTSLDLPVVARDAATLWDERWRYRNGIELSAEPVPGVHPPAPERRDLIAEFGKRREQGFSQILEEDAIYREVLSTVSSLGASAEASRLGRRALVTALVSLSVAVVALLVANTGGETLWSELLRWLAR